MHKIFIVFDNCSFKPVFIGKTQRDIIVDYEEILMNALKNKKDKLSLWIQDVWSNGNEILFHELQNNLNDEEVTYYYEDWKDKFSNLLMNKSTNKTSSAEKEIIEGLKNLYTS